MVKQGWDAVAWEAAAEAEFRTVRSSTWLSIAAKLMVSGKTCVFMSQLSSCEA